MLEAHVHAGGTMAELGRTSAVANPTKTFFVRMITRDISLEDCILDLIDNSIDGAWRSEGNRPKGLSEDADLSKYKVEILASAEEFSITDNCGGMSLDDAADYAFSFGRKVTDETDDYSIGIYGIGMKRAVFKLGEDILIRSTYGELADDRVSFAVPIDVIEWLKDDTPPWDFDIAEDDALPETGVRISVTNLTSAAHSAFGNPAFLQNLRRTIGRDYSLHLHRGLNISLNGKPISGWEIELLQGADFAPVRLEYDDGAGEDKVSIELIGGMAAPPPDTTDPDVEDDGEKRFGWYVVCNGRIVLAADKTTVSGWGTEDWPQWHRQYSGFMGIVIFTAPNAAALPLTTTKRSVDVSSEVYRRAKPKMREVTRAWIAYTNSRKQDLEEAKRVEAKAEAIPIYAVARRANVALPRYVATKPAEQIANVSYAVPLVKLKKLARALGRATMPYRDVGIKSFDYAYEEIVGDE